MLKDTRINMVNIGLMLFSCTAAFIMPFEVFLFAYAFMGPLHYLTEISWLHDRQYFAKGKYDYLILVAIGLFIAIESLAFRYHFWPFNNEENSAMAQNWGLVDKLLFLAFFGALIMAFVKNIYLKILALLLIFFISNGVFIPGTDESKTSNLEYIFSAFVPTLIHVYVFTGFFILYGALKNRSQSGLISFLVFIICPLLLFFLFRDRTFVPVTQYGMNAFGNTSNRDGFFSLNQGIIYQFFNPIEIATNTPGIDITKDNDASIWTALIYKSQTGILIMRFIAFAYMYHYLNWFSKTEIIRWHKVPKIRFVAVVALWIVSLVVYAIDYAKGLQWLFFLSFCHVLLEFPLNFKSIVGIGSELGSIAKTGFKAKQPAPVPKRS